MIKAIMYDKVANTNIGRMGYELRVVGHHHGVHGQSGEDPTLLSIVESIHRDVKVLVLSYDNGMDVIIPDRGIEKIIKR